MATASIQQAIKEIWKIGKREKPESEIHPIQSGGLKISKQKIS